MRTTGAVLCLAAAALAFASHAGAEGKGGDDWRAYCGEDMDRLCAGAPNAGACLHEHWDELSPKCREFKERMKKQWEGQKGADPMREACGADLKRLCADSDKPGVCLHEHWEELSPKCRAFKEGMKKQWGQKGPGKKKQGKDATR